MSADLITVTQPSISEELRISGQLTSVGKSTRWTSVYVWHWLKFQESWKLRTVTVSSTWCHTQLLQGKVLSETGTISVMITRTMRGVWCDYCRMRWGSNDARGQEQAVWSIRSVRHGRVINRHYCFTCAKEAQTRHDGTLWTFQEQLEYAKGIQRLDVQPK